MNETDGRPARHRFEARIFFDDKLMERKSGNDAEKLQLWMLGRAGQCGNFSGKVVDRRTGGKLVNAFRRSAPDS